MNTIDIKKTVAKWVETVVVDLNFCPFAKREVIGNRVRYSLSEAEGLDALMGDLESELSLLISDDSIETTLLIHPGVLQEFFEYNQFLDVANDLLLQMELEGIIQIASFHPDYQFAETEPGDVENYTNKSPYPMLHLLREESLEAAISSHPDSDLIPAKNIAKARSMGQEKMKALLHACFVKR